jgi:hypothetical protein
MGKDIADLADAENPAAICRDSGGGTAKSRRLAVRVKSLGFSPRKGRAITLPTFSGSTSFRTARQSS